MKVGIIGAGIVGGAIEHWFADAHDLFIHDPVRGTTLMLQIMLTWLTLQFQLPCQMMVRVT